MKYKLFTLAFSLLLMTFMANAQKATFEEAKQLEPEKILKPVKENNNKNLEVVFSEDFEGGQPADWTVVNGDDDWTFATTSSTIGWTVPPHTTFACINDGVYPTNINADVYIETPSLDFSDIWGPKLNFEAIPRQNFGWPYHRIYVSTDGGNYYELVSQLPWSPGSNEWLSWEIDLTAYEGMSDVRVCFYYTDMTSQFGDGFAIDDVVITKIDQHDLGVKNIKPLAFVGDYYPEVLLENIGYADQNTFDLAVKIIDTLDQSVVYNQTETFNELIENRTTKGFTMSTAWTTTVGDIGGYEVIAEVILADDVNPDNDIDTTAFNLIGEQTYSDTVAYGFIKGQGSPFKNKTLIAIGLEAGTITVIDSIGQPDILAGDFIGEHLYALDVNEDIWLVEADGTKHWAGHFDIDVEFIHAFTWDAKYKTGYIMIDEDGYNTLYSFNENWELTRIGKNMSSAGNVLFYGIACDIDGNLYGVSTTDYLYAFDRLTGEQTVIGGLGVNIGYAQDIGFDRNTGTLIGTLNGQGRGFYSINTTTGAVTEIYDMTQVVSMCAIPYSPIGDATLASLEVDGYELNTEFNKMIHNYTIELPYGTTVPPTVTAIASDENATVVITDADPLPGTTTVVVTSEDGTSELTYNVEFTIAERDWAVSNVISFAFEGEEVYPRVNLKNLGNFAENASFDITVSIIDTASQAVLYNETETYTDEIASQGVKLYTFSNAWTTNVGDAGTYQITAILDIDGDANADNDTLVTLFDVVSPDQTYRTDIVYSFLRNNAGSLTKCLVGLDKSTGTKDSINYTGGNFWAGDFIGDYLYMLSNQGNVFMIDADGKSHLVSKTGWNAVHGLAYDDANDIIYFTFFNGSKTILYTFDENWQVNEIGDMRNGTMLGIACDFDGNLYGIHGADSLYSIDPSTGAATAIGPLGVDIGYAQDIAYDRNAGVLYGALGPGKGLYTIDTETGAATFISSLGGNSGACAVAYLDTDATLSDLQVSEGTLTPAFDPETLSYAVELPYGSTIVPTTTYTTNHPDATAVVNDAASLPGTTTVVVTAEDGTTEITYEVDFIYENANNDATLSDLSVSEGTLAPSFDPTVVNYTVELPYGSTVVPTTTYTLNDPNADAVITDAASLPGTTTVVVTAEDGVTELTYTVEFTIAANDDATLNELTVSEGTLTPAFDPATLSYIVELPYGSTTVPTVTPTTNDVNANAVVTDATSVPGTTTIVVTAEDGVTELTYTVEFTIAANDDATLSNLEVSEGTLEPTFNPETMDYTVLLAEGSAVPTVTPTTTDANANAVVTDATSVPGTTTIVVTAEDGVTELTYSINFDDDAAIKELGANSIAIYPNPSEGLFNIEVEGTQTVIVMNAIGEVIATQKIYNTGTIDLSNQGSGVYFLSLQSNKEIVRQRLIVR